MAPKTNGAAGKVFPTYTGDSDASLVKYIERWARTILILTSLIAVAISISAWLGFHGPNIQGRLTAVEDTAHADSRRIDQLQYLLEENVYVSCKTLSAVEPKDVVKPKECE